MGGGGGGKGLPVPCDKGIGGEHSSVTVLHIPLTHFHAQHASSTTAKGRTEVGWGMEGWMDERRNGWMDGWMNGWMD